MIDRLTDRAQRVVEFGREAARERRAGEVRTEHLLLGLLREPVNLAHHVFERHNAPPGALRAAVDALGAPEVAGAVPAHLPLDRGAETALELALGETQRMGYAYIGCEHLLLGLLHDGAAARVLAEFDIDLYSSRATLEALVTGRSTE